MTVPLTPYSTATPLATAAPSWVSDEFDKQRLQAYTLYEAMYRNYQGTYVTVARGANALPIYLPTPRTIVETVNRHLARDLDYAVQTDLGTPADQANLDASFRTLFAREEMYAKLATQKRWGLVRGDAVWHVTADPTKLPGSRISITEVDPASYFPIEDDDNPGRIVGVHLVSQYEDLVAKKVYMRRRTYRKVPNTTTITTELALFELGNWDDRIGAPAIKLVQQLVPPTALPPTITALPVYCVRNGRQPENPFGLSEFAGIETVFAAINQAASDEDLTVALQGLGFYATDSGPPVNDDGDEVDWQIGPGMVAELDAGATMSRVQGVSSVTPFQDHIKMLVDAVMESRGITDAARGTIPVGDISGIALYLKYSPLIASTREKEGELLPTLDHMLFDLATMWFPGYEALNFGDARPTITVGDSMPTNKSVETADIISLVDAGIMAPEDARAALVDKGYYSFSAASDVLTAAAAQAAASADPFAARAASELNSDPTA